MKKVLFILVILALVVPVIAQREKKERTDSIPRSNWGAKLKESNFHLGLDLQTKYIWRGMEMMTEDAAPVLFPCANYSNKGFYVYIMGGYAVNGKYAEVDFGLSYTYKWFTIGFNDYWLEAVITIAPERVPLWLTVSNFFYGADRYTVVDEEGNAKEKQAYSTYAELGTYYDFLKAHRLSLALGAALNKSCYNGYEHNFSICNIELKYLYNLSIKDFSLPLGVAFIINPVYKKPFVNFTASFAF